MRKVDRKSVRHEAGDSTVDPLLVFVAVILFAVFAICELDRRGYTLIAICVAAEGEGIAPCLVGP
jgi:hypothetical protein